MKTILYYSSSRENPKFEQKIRDNITKQTSLPIISVTQKPIDFGENICVGDVGCSYLNEWRQILIGAKAAKTEYLVYAESDFLYPKEYFEFEPKGDDVYRCDNVWIIFKKFAKARRKPGSEGAQIVKRSFAIKWFEKWLKGVPQWTDKRARKRERKIAFMPHTLFHNEIPCVSFKTGDGMMGTTHVSNDKENRTYYLPYWGRSTNLKKEYLE